jgi:F0F1-type ATP synthase assembly protein I
MTAEGPSGRNIWVLFGQLTTVAWEFLGSIIAGALLGYFADRYLATPPWGLIVCTLFGSCSGLYRMVVMLRHLERRTNDK